jgi:predicted Rossmann fold nucleotide-binding protein DprA/Smf involved in DNA uptake
VSEILEACSRHAIRILSIGEKGYPTSLYALVDPPPLLFLRGSGSLPGERSVAVVGSRRATPVGRRAAERIGRELSEAGVTVVSGMALKRGMIYTIFCMASMAIKLNKFVNFK